ncbi:patatin-like phospholipase family protein [Anaerobacillus sp. CMMVII]|uniref:patatin-like phospholipase family protein n=1 Tax=Anaerobacillus sp. CMMVII TaxID=2755588 RepID=UPI0021B82324|nr:patatin-like phospholipase family protein [Anaerobacillus sp. CMMVII]MCT8138682.1 patatin-like phospholipase family protein [Anaerobacillus sp. CMMVII]
MDFDGVFAGGGIKAIAFVGALEAMEKKGAKFKRLAGTSAGGIFSALIIAGYTSKEIYEELDKVDFQHFLDPKASILPFSFMKWLGLYKRLGLYKGLEFEEWLTEMLQKKGISTFGDIEPGSLRLIASDLTRGRLAILPDDLPQYGMVPEKFSIARAVRMSSSLPYFFEPIKIYDGKGQPSIFVDGGVLSNFPIWLFMKKKAMRLDRPVIGFNLTPNLDKLPPNKITNAVEMFTSLFKTMRTAHDMRYISEEHAKNIVFIPVDNVSTIDFDLKKEEKEALITLGREKTETFFKTWH